MSMQEILDEYRIPYHTSGPKCRQGWLNLRCVYCERSPYLGYNLQYGYWNCWNCGPHNAADVVCILTGLSRHKAWEICKDFLSNRLVTKHDRHFGQYVQPDGVAKMGPLHREYLRGRGLDPVKMERLWQVQGIGQVGRLAWRLFIPIYQYGRLVAWTTRTIGDKEPRYISSSDSQSIQPIPTLLYGADLCAQSVVVVEGPVDVWRIGPGCVALLGLQVTPAKLQALSSFPVRTICFDNEGPAQARARALCRTLSSFPGETRNVVLSGKDAASSPEEEIVELRSKYL